MILGCIRKQNKQARDSRQVSSIPPWSLHQFTPPGSCFACVPALTSLSAGLFPGSIIWNKPFPPQVNFGHGHFYHSNRTSNSDVTQTVLTNCEPSVHMLETMREISHSNHHNRLFSGVNPHIRHGEMKSMSCMVASLTVGKLKLECNHRDCTWFMTHR